MKHFSSRLLTLVAGVALLGACAPATFVQTMEPNWNTITVRRGVSGDEAWNAVVDLAARRFDIEVISKEDGYLRTGWSHSWTGRVSDFYKVRTIIKVNADKTGEQDLMQTESRLRALGQNPRDSRERRH